MFQFNLVSIMPTFMCIHIIWSVFTSCYSFVHVCVSVFVSISVCASVYVYICAGMYVCMCMYQYVYVCIYVCCVFVYLCIYVFMCMCTYMCIHVYIHDRNTIILLGILGPYPLTLIQGLLIISLHCVFYYTIVI